MITAVYPWMVDLGWVLTWAHVNGPISAQLKIPVFPIFCETKDPQKLFQKNLRILWLNPTFPLPIWQCWFLWLSRFCQTLSIGFDLEVSWGYSTAYRWWWCMGKTKMSFPGIRWIKSLHTVVWAHCAWLCNKPKIIYPFPAGYPSFNNKLSGVSQNKVTEDWFYQE